MNWLASIYAQHPTMSPIVTYWTISCFIGALPAPQANSTQFYRFVFSFANALGANLMRAFSTKVESSPNFQQAVVKQNTNEGIVVPVVITPTPPITTKGV